MFVPPYFQITLCKLQSLKSCHNSHSKENTFLNLIDEKTSKFAAANRTQSNVNHTIVQLIEIQIPMHSYTYTNCDEISNQKKEEREREKKKYSIFKSGFFKKCFVHPIFQSFGHFSCVIFFPVFFRLAHLALQNINKDYLIFSYFRNFVAKKNQKPKTKNGMNETEVTKKESRSVCNLVVILHGEIFEFSYRSFFPS